MSVKSVEFDIAKSLLAAAQRRLKICDKCKKLAKSTAIDSPQYKGLMKRIIVANIDARELIAVARMLAEV